MNKSNIMWGKLTILVFLSAMHGTSLAEIYKYKDANGNWQFTDKPPIHSDKSSVVILKSKNSSSRVLIDFEKKLRDKYNPKSQIEIATLAVVKIKSKISTGSGFFVTDKCHVVTNKHVVRPTDTKSWLKQNDALKKEKESIKDAKIYIEEEKDRLGIRNQNLKEYGQYIKGLKKGEERDKEQRAYDLHVKKYKRLVRALDKIIADTNRREKEYKNRNSDFSMNASIATLAKSFKVVLKDDTELNANLVKVSKKEDLALLKIDKCKSPFLTLNNSVRIHQGLNIYAIGSPLGLKDYVTTGIVTNYSEESINTDAKILPGNSGGPLLTTTGEVIGVNTMKISAENAYNEGFGIAIPVSMIIKNFSSYLVASK